MRARSSPKTEAFYSSPECGVLEARLVWGQDQAGSIPVIPTLVYASGQRRRTVNPFLWVREFESHHQNVGQLELLNR